MKYTRRQLNKLIKDLLLKETIRNAVATQTTTSGQNLGKGFYSGMGGAGAVAALLLAVDNAIPSNVTYTYRIAGDTALPSGNEIVIAGVGQHGGDIEDMIVPMSLFGGSGNCGIEIKYSGTASKQVGIVTGGGNIPADYFDVLVHLTGGESDLSENVKFCVGIGEDGSGSISSNGADFVRAVFGGTITQSLFTGTNTINSESTSPASSPNKRKFSYNSILRCTNSREYENVQASNGTIINAAYMTAIAYSTYCRTEDTNLDRVNDLVTSLANAGTTVSAQDIVNLQCKFDEEGSSCFASLQHGNGRYLPIIPNYHKAARYNVYENLLVAAWPDLLRNDTSSIVVYDFSGAIGTTHPINGSSITSSSSSSSSSTGNTVNPPANGAPVNQAFFQITGNQLSTILAASTNPAAVQRAIDVLIRADNLSASGMITTDGVEEFLDVPGVDLNDLINVIQQGVSEKNILKAAIVLIHKKAKEAGLISGGAGSGEKKSKYMQEVMNISLSGTTQVPVALSNKAIVALGQAKAFPVINKYRGAKSWPLIKKAKDLKRVAKPLNKFNHMDVLNALRNKTIKRLNLSESIRMTRKDIRKILIEVLNTAESIEINDLVQELSVVDSNNKLPNDFSKIVPGKFIAYVNIAALNRLVDIFDEMQISSVEFGSVLNDIISDNNTESDAIANLYFRSTDEDEGGLVQFTGDTSMQQPLERQNFANQINYNLKDKNNINLKKQSDKNMEDIPVNLSTNATTDFNYDEPIQLTTENLRAIIKSCLLQEK